jgi:hypothetical protein
MMRFVLKGGHYLKIFKNVVVTNAVYVMDMLTGQKFSAKKAFHYSAVFKHILAVHLNPRVTIAVMGATIFVCVMKSTSHGMTFFESRTRIGIIAPIYLSAFDLFICQRLTAATGTTDFAGGRAAQMMAISKSDSRATPAHRQPLPSRQFGTATTCAENLHKINWRHTATLTILTTLREALKEGL